MAISDLIMTRNEAQAVGLKHYYTGKPCKRGHVARRRVSSNDCLSCSKERQQAKAVKKYKQAHYLLNQEKYKAAAIANYGKNKIDKIAYSLAYQKANSAKINANRSERKKLDILYREKERVRGLIKQSLAGNGFTKNSSTFEILGCSYQYFLSHIERQFLKGMTWENRKKWHIDHIIPIASAKCVDDLIKLNHHTNMRPLWARDNWEKSDQRIFLI